MPQNAATSLGQDLGKLLFGAPDDGKAAMEGRSAAYQDYERMQGAAKARMEAMIGQKQLDGLSNLRTSYKAMGYTDQQADVMANSAMANRGANLETAIGSAMMAQIPVAGSAAVPQGADVFQHALGRKTVELTDGQVYNPLGSTDQSVPLTALGQASVLDKGASARAHDAAATASYASADRQRAGIGADKASNYDLVQTDHGLIRVNKVTGETAPVRLGDAAVSRAPATQGGQVIDNGDGTTTYIPGSGVNTQERNNAGFYQRMVNADRELAALTDHGYDPTNLRDQATVGGLANALASSEGQQYHQAAQNWVRANLRKESGAAIGKDEMDQEIKNYFPVIGDGPGVIAQKAHNRAVVEQAMRVAAGRALPAGTPSLGAAVDAPPAATATYRAINPTTGHAVVWNGSAWVPEQ